MKILYLYKWCTFGGVERVLINRALAFRRHGIPVRAKVYFYYSGVIKDLADYLQKHNLREYLWICEDPYDEKYDAYISIDTEEAFDTFRDIKLILEHHTTYEEHGRYLRGITPDRLQAIFVPTDHILRNLKNTRPELFSKVYILPNFVIDEGFEDREFILPNWKLFPVVFIGRTDTLKNPHFLVSAIRNYIEKYGEKFFLCIVGGSVDERNFMEHIRKEKLEHRVVFYPFIRFERVKAFLKQMEQRRAIFASASKGESFGMSVAEAIFFGLPVLISDIPPHRELVQNDERFIFKLNSKEDFISSLIFISENYDSLKGVMENFRVKLNETSFLKAWNKFWQIIS